MVYKIRNLPSAACDSEGIVDYLVQVLGSKKAASRFKADLRNCHKLLREHPLMYPVCSAERLAARSFRIAPVMSYIAFYKVDEKKKIVWIHRIMHGTMDHTQQNMD